MQQTAQQQTASNVMKAYNEYNALKIRLDTEPLIEKIELFLRGEKLVPTQDPTTGKIQVKRLRFGMSKANDLGIQSLLNWISATVNTQVVQGNFPADSQGHSEKYDSYIEEYHIELTKMIIANAYNWDILDDEIDGIISAIMLLIVPFMSRCIDNKERESYGETFKTIESSSAVQRSKMPLFGS